MAERQNGSDIYRYHFTGTFSSGNLQFNFLSETFTDASGLGNAGFSENFLVRGSSALLVSPASTVTGLNTLNQQGYLEVRFAATSGHTIDAASILDAGPELVLTGPAAADVALSGQPVQVDAETFRYPFTGSFTTGSFTLTFLAGSMQDSDGAGLTGWSEDITLRTLTSTSVYPEDQSNTGRNQLNERGYFDVELDDVFGVGMNSDSLTDAGQEIQLYQIVDGEETPVAGIGVNGIAEHVSGNVWRYRFSGRFEPGLVYVRFLEGSWTDNAGNASVTKVESFNVYSNAFSFEIHVKGAAELYAAVESLKLVSIKGDARLTLDVSSDTGRVQLDLNGRADVMYFGTVGAASGRFIFQAKAGETPGFWGVMKIDTNFEKLRPAGY
ncbi:MAG UNVERIFIED_CONTAM: hypothetical protein LVR18_35130 [Planctomycetaceae bacterium]